jgi:hypothetical protein
MYILFCCLWPVLEEKKKFNTGWFSQNAPVSSTNKTNSPNLSEMLLKVSLSFITLTQNKKRVVHPKLDIYVLVIRATSQR